MRCRNPVVDRHRAEALKRAQAVLQRTLSTPAKVDSLRAEELEDLQESEVEVRHCLSLAPRRRRLRIRRSQGRRMKTGKSPLEAVSVSYYLKEQLFRTGEPSNMDQSITNDDGSISIVGTMVPASDSDQPPSACGLQLVDEEDAESTTSTSS